MAGALPNGPAPVVTASDREEQRLHYDGAAWAPMTLPAEAGVLNEVWGTSASDVYAVGSDGLVLRYDGAAWTATVPTPETLLGVCQGEPGEVLAVGTGGTILSGIP